MRIKAKKNGSAVAVLNLEGRLTAGAAAARLSDEVDALLEENCANIVLNMQHVDLVDCAGIGQLVNCYLKTRKQDGCLKLTQVDRRLRHLLELFRLDTVLEVFESERVAVASLVASQPEVPTRHLGLLPPGAGHRSVLIPIIQSQRAN